MGFADRYISRQIQGKAFLERPVDPGLEMIVVIPVYDEPEVTKTLDSLAACIAPDGVVEVLLVINESEITPAEIIAQNDKTAAEVKMWQAQHPGCFFRVRAIRPKPFRRKYAGVGLARKTGMDEAVRRFAQLDKADGVLISLDADTLVASNYFTEIQTSLRTNEKAVGATIRFQHRIDELENERQRLGMMLYELYLHYYKQALDFTGYPYAIYTIGSAFAVRAQAYVKQGGMSKRQAGEDFYFLHKLTAMGEIIEINSTCVFPSARVSNRVPFGTGPSLHKWMDGDDSLRVTYAFHAFCDLQQFFKSVPDLLRKDTKDCELPESIAAFLQAEGFSDILSEIRKNSASGLSFKKRFFQYFNAFKILKFLNFAHPSCYVCQDLNEAMAELKASLH